MVFQHCFIKKKKNSFSFPYTFDDFELNFFIGKSIKIWYKICLKHGTLEIITNYEIIVQELMKNWKTEEFCRKMLSHQSKFVCRTFSQNSGKFADIVVVGGGLVGSALACKLAKSQWLTSRKICLLESSAKKPAISQDVSNTPFSNRLVLYGPYKI